MSADTETTRAVFSRQWNRFGFDARVWGVDEETRFRNSIADFEREPGWFRGKRILDAGCGNGTLAAHFAALGADVTAIDLSDSVVEAQRRFTGVRFIRADLMEYEFERNAFDAIYSGGALHHTRNTRQALEHLLPALDAGGVFYVWLYANVAGTKYAFKKRLRRLPAPARSALVPAFVLQARLRHRDLALRDHWLAQHDFFMPTYRWEHTPDEVVGWFTSAGLTAKLGSTNSYGFGVLAQRAHA